MFLDPLDLDNVIYGYQLDQITENDDTIVLQGLAAAEEEAKSYLEPNPNQNDYLDGRLLYDVAVIFAKTGAERNALILQHTLTIAKWHIIQLCNADVIYEHAKERYDRAVDWFDKMNSGAVKLSSLPVLDRTEENTEKTPFSSGSRAKFNHEY